MTQNLGPISDVSSVGLLNEIGTALPLWTSLNDNNLTTFLKPVSGISHAEAKFRTNIATFGRGNVTSVSAFLTIDTTEIYSITATLLDNNNKAIATNTIESDNAFNFTLTYDKDSAASFDLSNLFIFFSIDIVSQSNLNSLSEITFFSIIVSTEIGGIRQSGQCGSCQKPIPCPTSLGSHKLYFHDLSGSGVDTTGNCSAPVLQDNHFEYYGEHLIHKSNSLDFGVASVDLGLRHILTYDDTVVQLDGISSCVNVPQILITIFTDIGVNQVISTLGFFTSNNTLSPIFSDPGQPAQEHPECLRFRVPNITSTAPIIVSDRNFRQLSRTSNIIGLHSSNKASIDQEYHINSVDNDDNIYNVQQNFNDIYIDFLHTDNNGNKTYFDGHHLYDHHTYGMCNLPDDPNDSHAETDGDCIPGIVLPEDTISNFRWRLVNACKIDELACFIGDEDCEILDELTFFDHDHGFSRGEHTYHDHRITFALSAKAQLWTAPKSGRHHDNTGGYTNTGGAGLFFRNDLGSGIAFMPINNLPLSSGLIGFVDNANNFTPLDLEISGDFSTVFRDSDELTIGISEQTLYRVIRPILPVDRVHDGPSRAENSVEATGGEWEGDPNFLESGTFVEVVRGNYSLSVSILGHCFHEGETSSFIIPSGLFSAAHPPTDVGVCGFGGFQAKDLCVNYSHLREHLIPYNNHVVRTAELCDEFGQPDFSGISERIITPPDDPSLYDFKGCFND